MENRILCLFLALAYCAILWAACQPPPTREDDACREFENVRICQKKEVAATQLGVTGGAKGSVRF